MRAVLGRGPVELDEALVIVQVNLVLLIVLLKKLFLNAEFGRRARYLWRLMVMKSTGLGVIHPRLVVVSS